VGRDKEGHIIDSADKSYVGRLSAKGNNQIPERLTEGEPQFWSVDGSRIYYTKGPDEKDSGLYRVVLATKQSKRVADLHDFYMLGRVAGTNSVFVEQRNSKTLAVMSLDGTAVSLALQSWTAVIQTRDSEGRYLHKIEESGPHQLSLKYYDATQGAEHIEFVNFQ